MINITSWTDLNAIRNDLTEDYQLTKNLNIADDDYIGIGDSWSPIGNLSTPFIGSFDGKGYKIYGLTISTAISNAGLFGYTSSSCSLSNIGLLDVNISGKDSVGALVGWNNGGTISNIYSTGVLNSNGGNAGGLVGVNHNSGNINISYSEVDVTGSGTVGGFVGYNDSTINNSYASGSVIGNDAVGGFVGWNWNTSGGVINKSYSVGSVVGNTRVGGFVTVDADKWNINFCFWDTETSGQTIGGGTGKTTLQMKTTTTFTDAGWDYITPIWYERTPANYPKLEPESSLTNIKNINKILYINIKAKNEIIIVSIKNFNEIE